MQPTTSQQALRRAFWTIKVPSMVCFFGPLVAFLFWSNSSYANGAGLKGLWYFFAALPGGFLMSWLVWSIGVPRWRLWAYERVPDIVELKQDAERAQLLWPEGHFFEKTEIASKRLRLKISQVEMERTNAASAV